MNKQEIDCLLYSIPVGVDYTTMPEELDIEDVPQERINGLIKLLSDKDESLQFDSARLLTQWGIDEGFNALVRMFDEGKTEGFIEQRLHGYDDTDQHILSALIGYWASKAEQNKQNGDEARRKIFPYVAKIIQNASVESFSISGLFWLITKYNFTEYVPLVKGYLRYIIDFPNKQYWKIHDSIKFLLEIEPEFIHNLLERKHKKLSDFGL
ncbi:hypothetical protein HYE59_06280 [Aggregatibacter actinomycetemcomitans]|uniref:hypothetical protein n=1 Tax=Aggregatibacter actinomycetemcomitans TaxID=714 RepID=UPI00197B6F21|nr:hypothetical protein [Aggregatibacter actinomycetemcomitans]MBN6077145.1 hypothetical protein [Aggregatibacter actinomycetemcomitans]